MRVIRLSLTNIPPTYSVLRLKSTRRRNEKYSGSL
ncbi:hypothetical protein KMC26_gp169 [Escherichia phage teqskov]|uniref:Uncharacterized protein n=1 Tax=Escherichia phage teqskov TaxID=2697539 RepID=A0A6B9WGH7_9CAUD|nr:hypothetical protein KMC26_gp169 [Escherichia phage teqskov]QHR64407.1 hypothetical protein teqskov_263 [Escherichia phage teqskov]